MKEKYGAFVVSERLMFILLDGSSISCDCIAGPYAVDVAKACNKVSPILIRAITTQIMKERSGSKRMSLPEWEKFMAAL